MGVKSPFDQAMEKALRLLAVRARSVKEIRSRLRDKGVEGPVAEKVIEKLLDLNYLDDASFARQWARHLAIDLLYGNRKIEASLKAMGIEGEVIREAISETREELGEKEAIGRVLRKKAKYPSAGKLDKKQYGRMARMLAGKGYPSALIYEALGKPEEDDA